MRARSFPSARPPEAILAIGITGCLALASPAGAATHNNKSITKAQAAKQYLADVGPSNAAINAYESTPSASTIPAAVTALAPVIAADTKLASLLSHQQWPSGIKADIKMPDVNRSGDFRKSDEYLRMRVRIWDLLRDEVLKARVLEEA